MRAHQFLVCLNLCLTLPVTLPSALPVSRVARATVGFYSAMTLVPMKLGAKIDRLTIGVLPVKMKLILCLDSPRWMSLMMKVFGVFMSRKMRSRIKVKKQEWAYVSECFGQACIPAGFGECGGTLSEDPVLDAYERIGSASGAAPMQLS